MYAKIFKSVEQCHGAQLSTSQKKKKTHQKMATYVFQELQKLWSAFIDL